MRVIIKYALLIIVIKMTAAEDLCEKIEKEIKDECWTAEFHRLKQQSYDAYGKDEQERFKELQCRISKLTYPCGRRKSEKYKDVKHCMFLRHARQILDASEKKGCRACNVVATVPLLILSIVLHIW
ncbi:Uncharacterised protein g6392 [Pycnogonum litorale]